MEYALDITAGEQRHAEFQGIVDAIGRSQAVPACAPSGPPAASAARVGAVNLRVIPVLDLRRMLDSPVEPAGPDGDPAMDIVVVVVHDGHIFGLLASDVRGVVSRAGESRSTVATTNDATALIAETFDRDEDGPVGGRSRLRRRG